VTVTKCPDPAVTFVPDPIVSPGQEREGKKVLEADAGDSAAASRGILLMTEKAARGEADGLEREGCGEGREDARRDFPRGGYGS
jgi:hypothetical protein